MILKKNFTKAWNRMAKLGRRPFDRQENLPDRLAGYSEWIKYKKTKDAPADIPDRSYKGMDRLERFFRQSI